LGAVDLVAKYPSASPYAKSVSTLAAEPASAAGRDAGDKHPISGLDRSYSGTHLLDGSDRFVTEYTTVDYCRHIALEDVQVGPANGYGIDTHDGVAVLNDGWLGNLFPFLVAWSVVHNCTHYATSNDGLD
jgi:hypothetical protein